MELFRYRRLALGCSCFLLTLLISYFVQSYIKVATLVFSIVAIVALIILFIVFKNSKALKTMCVLVPVFLFISIAMIVSLVSFNFSKIEKLSENKICTVTGTIENVHWTKEHMGSYQLKISSINGKKINKRVNVTCYGKPLSRTDIVSCTGYFEKIENSPFGYDEIGINRHKGIEYSFTTSSYTVTGFEKTPILNFFARVNAFLDKQLQQIDDYNSYGLMSALFLGNEDNLQKTTKRDFSRLGLSHILALSGMHIAIIISMLCFALYPLKIKPLYKEIILILSTVFFVCITGFSLSAIRSGVMVCMTYTLSFFGTRINIITSLFLSVTLICVFNPYSIFSLSLILSLFSLLGCIVIMKFAKRLGFLRKIRYKPLRHIVISLLSSTFALLFTIPIIYLYFGRVSLLSPITNLFLSPIFTLLIYLTPLFIIFAKVPLLGNLIAFLCKAISNFLLFIGEAFAKEENIVVHIVNGAQGFAIVVIVCFILAFLIFNKKIALISLGGILIGIIIFACGTISLNNERNKNVYVSVASVKNSDYILLEDKGDITLFDMTRKNVSGGGYGVNICSSIGYSYIHNYVITGYSKYTLDSFELLSGNMIVENVYLFPQKNENEKKIANELCTLAKSRGISTKEITESFKTKSATINILLDNDVINSSVDTCAISIEHNSTVFTYLGSGSLSVANRFFEEYSYKSDILVFGAFGPDYKTEFSFNAPYLDYCLFLGKSFEYVTKNFPVGKIIKYEDEPVRFKLED